VVEARGVSSAWSSDSSRSSSTLNWDEERAGDEDGDGEGDAVWTGGERGSEMVERAASGGKKLVGKDESVL
jgi:hypothetical protein